MKTCKRCNLDKELDCFPIVSIYGVKKQIGTCKKCKIEIRRKSSEKNRKNDIKKLLERRNSNPFLRLRHSYQYVPNNFLRDGSKYYSHIVGLSHSEFRDYLESKFEPWMTWENRQSNSKSSTEPYKTWTIDHIIPMSSAKNEDDMIRLSHYTNLAPICSFINTRIKLRIDNYYEISYWSEMEYRTELSDNGIQCFFRDYLIDQIDIKSSKYNIIKTFEKNLVERYLKQIS